jgi:hypothetical protein
MEDWQLTFRKTIMISHVLMNMHAIEKTYDRADRSKMLLEDYLKAVSELNRNMRK